MSDDKSLGQKERAAMRLNQQKLLRFVLRQLVDNAAETGVAVDAVEMLFAAWLPGFILNKDTIRRQLRSMAYNEEIVVVRGKRLMYIGTSTEEGRRVLNSINQKAKPTEFAAYVDNLVPYDLTTLSIILMEIENTRDAFGALQYQFESTAETPVDEDQQLEMGVTDTPVEEIIRIELPRSVKSVHVNHKSLNIFINFQ